MRAVGEALRVAALVALAAAVVVLGAVASARLHVEAAPVRRALAASASSMASGAVQGRLRIDGMHAPRDGRWRFDSFEVWAPGGARTMVLRDVAIRPAWKEIVSHRGLVLDAAEVGSGRISLGVPQQGKTSLERAFASAGAGSGSGTGAGDAPRDASEDGGGRSSIVWIRSLAFRELVFGVDVAQGPRLRFAGLEGGGELRLDRGADVTFRAWDVDGQASLSSPSLSMALSGMKVWVRGGRPDVATVVGEVTFAGGTFPLAFEHDSEQALARVCAWMGDTDLTARLVMQAIGGLESIAGVEAVDLRVVGEQAPPEPRCEAAS